VLDRHHIDADPDLTFHFDADPDLNPDPTPSFTHVGKSEFFSSFIHSSANLHSLIFLVIVIGVIILIFLDSLLKFSGKIIV
jgi:hypothetical protein